MTFRLSALSLAILATMAAPVLAQSRVRVPPNNASTSGSEGPNSNSAGYPAVGSPGGALTTTKVGPATRTATRRTSHVPVVKPAS